MGNDSTIRGPNSADPPTAQAPDETSPRQVFVIMPFVRALTRNQVQLTAFFDHQIKRPIETASNLKYKYAVTRSDDTFDITEEIVRRLYFSHIVIADLSGVDANPNVMYELGLRLAFSNRPVILIREQHPENKRIFDIAGFYTENYDPLNLASVSDYLVKAVRNTEARDYRYKSPVLKVLEPDIALLESVSRNNAVQRLWALTLSLQSLQSHFVSYLVSYAVTHTPLKVSDFQADPVTAIMTTHREALWTMSYADFKFAATGPMPPLDHLLAIAYLNNFLPPGAATGTYKMFSAFQQLFLSTNAFWQSMNMVKCTMFMTSCVLVEKLAAFLNQYIAATDPKQAVSALSEVVDILKHWEIILRGGPYPTPPNPVG